MLGSAGWVVTGWASGIKLDPKPELGDARSQTTLFLCGDGEGVSKEATCPNSEKWLNQDNELHWKDLKNAISLLPWLLYLLGDIKGQCIAKYYTLGGLKMTEISCGTVLEAGGLKSRCGQGWFLMRALREKPSTLLSSIWWRSTIFASLACRSLAPCSHGLFPVSLSFHGLLLMRTPTTLD